MNVLESIRPEPGNDIREMETGRLVRNAGLYGSTAALSTASAIWYTTPGSWFNALAITGAIATGVLAIPGLIELTARRMGQ